MTAEQTGVAALQTFGICSNGRAGQPLYTHIHQDCVEIVYLEKGFQVYEAAGESFSLTGGDIFVSYPNEPHGSGDFPENVCDIVWMQVNLREGIPFFGLEEGHAAALRAALRGLPHQFCGDAALRESLHNAFYALSCVEWEKRFLGEQLLVCALLRMKQLADRPRPYHAASVGDALAFIHDNLTEPILLEEVADACGLSLSWFKMKFKEEMGVTPRDYINHVKIERAKHLLRSGFSVTAAASAMGFNSPNYFSVTFKKYTGETPIEYRRRHLLQKEML